MNPTVPPVLPATGLPPAVIQATPRGHLTLNGQLIGGTEGMTPAALLEALDGGGRLVVFQYCISVLVMSFKPSSGILFIQPGRSAVLASLPYSLLSLCLGWWGRKAA